MFGGAQFPPVGDRPYFLSLPPWGFYWFRLPRPKPADEEIAP